MFYFVLRPERLAADALQSISLTGVPAEAIEKNASVTLTIEKTPANAASNAAVTWISSNDAIATVDANGKVTGVSVGTATITAYCDGYSASCTVTVKARSITTGALTAEEKTAIENYTVEDLTTGLHLNVIAGNAYDAADIDLSKVITGSVNDIRKLFMNENCTLIAEPNEELVKMLVPGYYGGSKNSTTSSATNKTFVTNDFKVGDLFCAFSKTTACIHGTGKGWKYYTGIYQGDGKFLVSCYAGSCVDCHGIYEDVYSEEGTQLKDCYTSIWSENAADMNNAYLFYFVLRPERLAADAVQSISLNETELDLYRKSQETLTVTTDPETVVDATKVTWVSSNEAVATVGANGQVTGESAGTAVITAYYEGYSASCEVTVDSKRLITSGALTQAEMDAISALTREDLNALSNWNPGTVAMNIYGAANVNTSSVLKNQGFSDVRKYLFNNTTGELLEESDVTNTNYLAMLIPGFYGGAKYKTTTGENGRTFTPNDLKVGDLFIAYDSAACGHEGGGTNTVTGVYLGEGKFLLASKNAVDDACHTTYIDAYDAAQSVDMPTSVTSVWANGNDLNAGYAFYFVLRPERLAPDALQSISLNQTALPWDYTAANSLPAANAATLSYTKSAASAADPVSVVWTTSNPDVATVDQSGNVTAVGAGNCTITVNCDGYKATCEVTITRTVEARSSLTATEQAALQSFSVETIAAYADFAKNAYSYAGIDISEVFAKYGFYDLARKNFDVDNTLGGGKYALLDESTMTEEQRNFREMLVYGSYAGSNISTGKAFAESEFELGDLFFAVRKCPTSDKGGLYIVGIYQGAGKFLVYELHPTACRETCRTAFVDQRGVTPAAETVVWGTTNAMKTNLQFYFVLRPSRLSMRVVEDGAITQAEQEKLAAYTRETVGGTLSEVVKEAYTQAGIVVDWVFGKYAFSDARKALISEASADRGLLIEGNTIWHQMLVDGYYGGAYNAESTAPTNKTFAPADFQIGDVFCSITKCVTENEDGTKTTTWPSATAIYVGNGRFVVSVHATCDCKVTYIDDIAQMTDGNTPDGHTSIWASDVDALNNSWLHYFVLRPSQLAQ